MKHRTTITPHDLIALSEPVLMRLWRWWEVDYGDLFYARQDDTVEIAGDADNSCLDKSHGHYNNCFPLLSIAQLIQYLDDQGIYRDPKTGITHADGIPADQLCDFLWSRTAAHLEYGDDPQPLPEFVGVVR